VAEGKGGDWQEVVREGFRDGVKLCQLLECLTSLPVKHHPHPTNLPKRTENATFALDFIESKVSLLSYGWNAKDVEVEPSSSLLFLFLFPPPPSSLFLHFPPLPLLPLPLLPLPLLLSSLPDSKPFCPQVRRYSDHTGYSQRTLSKIPGS